MFTLAQAGDREQARQLSWFDHEYGLSEAAPGSEGDDARGDSDEDVREMTREELLSFDRIVVFFSGGKDCTAAFLHLLELGVDRNRIELWHHEIDGREEVRLRFDWPFVRDYCRKFADAFWVNLFYSWRIGGFEGEMLKQNAKSKPVLFQTPTGVKQAGGVAAKISTRRRFPQVSADLSVRWCSSYLKIDVASLAINHQERFLQGKTLMVSGERAEESPSRARYRVLEPHRCDNRDGKQRPRYIDHWRPVHGWTEAEVWDIMRRHRINPAPPYLLGWGRLSCMCCIFGSPNQWASIAQIAPERLSLIAEYESDFGFTINRHQSVLERVKAGTAYPMKEATVKLAMSEEYTAPIILPDGVEWELPLGAFGEKDGPC